MDYQELRQAVSEAARRKDHALFRSLVDEFLDTAQGEEYAQALCLQADGFILLNPKEAVLGFILVDEALLLLTGSPVGRLYALITALGLCFVTRDVGRAGRYEEAAYRLLLEHSSNPVFRANRHRLQMNQGHVAMMREDYSTAYWHFAQAAHSVACPDVPEEERRGYEWAIQVNTAIACLRVRRFYEAQEALDLAEQSSPHESGKLRAQVLRMELLRQLGSLEEAEALARSLADKVPTCGSVETIIRYYWNGALLAQDTGDSARYHELLKLAQEMAVEHRYDHLLGEIQRLLRAPL